MSVIFKTHSTVPVISINYSTMGVISRIFYCLCKSTGRRILVQIPSFVLHGPFNTVFYVRFGPGLIIVIFLMLITVIRTICSCPNI
jgi:hypothetical protein